jgi:hypothetical protein
MKKKAHSSNQPQPPAEPARCLFADARGHQCRMLRLDTHPALCVFHARQEQQLLDAGRVAAELASLSGEFKTANDVNHALGKLFAVVAANRMPARSAAVLAYIGQLLLQSLPRVKSEYERGNGMAAWDQLVRATVAKAFPRLPAGAAPTSPSLAATG